LVKNGAHKTVDFQGLWSPWRRTSLDGCVTLCTQRAIYYESLWLMTASAVDVVSTSVLLFE